MIRDLVCGMDVDEYNPPFTFIYNNEKYYFCSFGCKRAFEKEPEKYISNKPMEHHHNQSHNNSK